MGARGWKVVAAMLALCCGALAYHAFDQGLTRTYADASAEESARHSASLAGLVEYEWSGLTQWQLMTKLRAYAAIQGKGSVVLKRDPETGDVYLDGVRFEFRDGKLVKVI
jgi:hypothetical protein